MDIKLIIVFLTSVMAIVLAYLNFRLSKKSNKNSKQTELRAQSYIDFINTVAEIASSKEHFNDRPKDLTNKLIDAKTRIAIYGDPEVITKLAKFDRDFAVINSEESLGSFLLVALEMRKSATGRYSKDLEEDIHQILFGK